MVAWCCPSAGRWPGWLCPFAVSHVCSEAFSPLWSGDLGKRHKDEAASPSWDLDVLGHLGSSLILSGSQPAFPTTSLCFSRFSLKNLENSSCGPLAQGSRTSILSWSGWVSSMEQSPAVSVSGAALSQGQGWPPWECFSAHTEP